jgi:hypothetical protein
MQRTKALAPPSVRAQAWYPEQHSVLRTPGPKPAQWLDPPPLRTTTISLYILSMTSAHISVSIGVAEASTALSNDVTTNLSSSDCNISPQGRCSCSRLTNIASFDKAGTSIKMGRAQQAEYLSQALGRLKLTNQRAPSLRILEGDHRDPCSSAPTATTSAPPSGRDLYLTFSCSKAMAPPCISTTLADLLLDVSTGAGVGLPRVEWRRQRRQSPSGSGSLIVGFGPPVVVQLVYARDCFRR